MTVSAVVAAAACSARPRPGPAGPPASAPPAPAAVAPPAYRAYVGATVIASPEAAPIPDGVVLVEGATIAAVGARHAVRIPDSAAIIDARGATITAAFWNCHVHFMEPALAEAATAPAAQLTAGLGELATRWGFAYVVDTGSGLANSAALRRRVLAGEVKGPAILLAGAPFIAVGGQPIYVSVPLPALGTPEEGRAAVRDMAEGGADLIKLMTASVVARPPSPVMPVAVIRAVTEAAHARGLPVMAHPTNLAGVNAARDGGVDLLAHTAPQDGPWSRAQAASLVAAGVALIPTVSLWRYEIADAALADRFERAAVQQVASFAAAGGTLLFGTDAGYRPEHDPTREHQLLAGAGLSFAARLAMLTTLPAARFNAPRTGKLAPGLDADLVILDGDPVVDPAAFAKVRCTVRGGDVLAGDCVTPSKL